MAKCFRAPKHIPLPSYSQGASGETNYIETLKALAKGSVTTPKTKPNIDMIGEIIRFQRADGYAQYMIWDTKPLQLVWLELGDAYGVEEALIRGLRLEDVKQMVERERALRDLFKRQS